MREIFITMYEAEDGRKFTNKKECLDYENEIKKIKNFKRALEAVSSYCAEREDCDNCPFHVGDKCGIGYPSDEWIIEED